MNNPLHILQVSTADVKGGAEKVARGLFRAYGRRGHHSWLAVGYKQGRDPRVIAIPNDENRDLWARFWLSVSKLPGPLSGTRKGRQLQRLVRGIGMPGRIISRWLGREEFDYPGAWKLLDSVPRMPDIVHCHNLHGSYFDLRALPWLTGRVPVILTLHDAWLLSGHCAHSFDCERWRVGCGKCPDLTIYPAVRRDATGYNWKRKRDIYAESRFYVSTPSRWLMDKVKQSVLAPGMVQGRVIPNGVDLSVFKPGDKQAARKIVGLSPDADVLLFAGCRTRSNPWKDYDTLKDALLRIAGSFKGQELTLVCLGEEHAEETIGPVRIKFVGYLEDPVKVALFYQAADIYVHPAKIDTFPNTVLEALACGIPVVATAVGGIPEQVTEGVTGFLVPLKDSGMMAERIRQLLKDGDLRSGFGRQAEKEARARFDLSKQVDAYLDWYKEITGHD